MLQILLGQEMLYVLYCNQRGEIHGINRIDSQDSSIKSLKDFVMALDFFCYQIEGLLYGLSDGFFDDYGFDQAKVFDDSILNYQDCYYPEILEVVD
ncbi:hypothetical protein [uncultured Helicobacter sp.]|uniref:hypothetical protein n=1 Tax=uncultured Helicobacter sp. TaxID=175537 RepID=UPI00374FA95E